MSVATLKFELPLETEEFKHALKGFDYFLTLEEVKEAFRQKRKYGEISETTWDEAEQLFWQCVKDRGIEL